MCVGADYSPDTMELESDGEGVDWEAAEKFVKDTLGYDLDFDRLRG